MAGSSALANMFGIGELPSGEEIRFGIDNHNRTMSRVEDYLRQMAESSTRRPDLFELDQAGNTPGSVSLTLPPFFVPIGKRVIIYRVTSTAPAGSGPMATYASASGASDGNSLVNVIAAPQIAVYESAKGFVVHGGMQLVTVFQAVAVGGGVCTVHYEGDLFPEEDDRSERY